MILAILGRLKDRELSSTLSKLGFRAAEIEAIEEFPGKGAGSPERPDREKDQNADRGLSLHRKAAHGIRRLSTRGIQQLGGLSKVKAYLHKWRPIRQSLPIVATELEALGMPRGPKFDQIVQDVFAIQLNGRGKTPEERVKILRKLSGIKEAPKKKEKEKKPAKVEKHVESPSRKKGRRRGKTSHPRQAQSRHESRRCAAKRKPKK